MQNGRISQMERHPTLDDKKVKSFIVAEDNGPSERRDEVVHHSLC